MNILRIIYDWPDANNITEGLAPAPYELSLAQAKLGHKIYVLCGNLNGKNLKSGRFVYSLAESNIVVYNLPRGLRHFGPFLSTSLFVFPYYIYLKFVHGIDLIHNHGHMGLWFLIYKWLFGWVDKTPLVAHYHNTAKGRERNLVESGGEVPFWPKYFEYPLHKLSDYLNANLSNKIIAVAGNLKDEIIEFYRIDSTKIEVVESGVDTSRFTKDGDKVKFGFSEDSKYLLNIGRLSKRKNIDVIVESLSLLPVEYKLILCGTWDADYKKVVDKLIEKHKLKDRIKYIGNLSYFETDKYYRSADIFVLPSSYEGLPKVILEALSSGCKVIASGFDIENNMPDLYFLGEISSRELAAKIKEVEASSAKYNETRQIISKNYSWDSRAQKVEHAYKSFK